MYSVIIMDCGDPNARKAVLEGRLVLQGYPVTSLFSHLKGRKKNMPGTCPLDFGIYMVTLVNVGHFTVGGVKKGGGVRYIKPLYLSGNDGICFQSCNLSISCLF